MATMFASRTDRSKKVIQYGKSGSRSTYSTKHVDSWTEDDALLSQPAASKPSVKETYQINKRDAARDGQEKAFVAAEAHKATLRPVKSQQAAHDVWDVPADDEICAEFELNRRSPPRLTSSRKLVDDEAMPQESLAPWERKPEQKKTEVGPIVTGKNPSITKAERVEREEMNSPKAAKQSSPSASKKLQQPQSAVALLAARRKHSVSTTESRKQELAKSPPGPAKRAGAILGAHLPRKRIRQSPASEKIAEDVDMEIAPCALAAEPASKGQTDILDFPADDDGEPTLPSVIAPTSKPARTNERRGKLSSVRRSAPLKGSSAPGRLSVMLPADTDSTDASRPAPSIMSSPPSTPASDLTRARSPSRQPSASKTMTPKQAQLWSQLLPHDRQAPTPSHLAMQDLTLNRRRKPAAPGPTPKLTLKKSVSDVPELHRRRTRLVDRLKAAASSSEAESSDDDADVEMEDDNDGGTATQQIMTAPLIDESAYQQSQGQLQSQSQSQSGARVTYARTRSYLQEDSLDDVLFGLQPAEVAYRQPSVQRQPSKNGASQSQKSAFDLDDSDDEQSRGGLRTIHELRAAGRNDRFTQDTAALLDDIADHSISARARRRTALSELTLKLGNKAFVERFIGKGFEHKIIAELSAPEDQIADAILAAAFAILLASEPQQHVIAAIAEAVTVGWATRLLGLATPLARMSKERRFDMSRAGQSDLADSAEKLQMSGALWTIPQLTPPMQLTPSALSPRIVALRLLDLLVGKLRKLGDRSNIVDEAQLSKILDVVRTVDTTERNLVISVLESLSTFAPSLDWPAPGLETIASAVHQATATDSQSAVDRHTTFLAFRLTLNLTNTNARNCTYFAFEELIVDLLVAIKKWFASLDDSSVDHETRILHKDLLTLAMGIMINLADHSASARLHTMTRSARSALTALLDILADAQESMKEAESLDDSQTNVAYGYLAVMLANLSLDRDVRRLISARLPGQNLDLLVSAVEEFVRHNQRVDAMSHGMDGSDGRQVWGAFTETLQGVLVRLTNVAAEG